MQPAIVLMALLLSTGAQAFDWKKYISPADLKTLRFGAGTNLGLYQPAEADGGTSMAGDLMFINGVASMRFRKNNVRLWADVSYQYFETEATESEIGQQVGRYKALVSYQQFFQINGMRFWAGGGGGLITEIADSRHTVDSDGYLKENYGSRTTFDLMAAGNIHYPLLKFRAGIPIELGLSAQVGLVLQSASPSLEMGATFMF